MPAGATPSEHFAAVEQGADMVKVFPAARLGAPAFIKDLPGPFPHLRVMCTGGVTRESTQDFLAAGAYCVGLSRG
jgi:2-dehydro-3-deoxyphosphogluconate aldolase/(4S)-4-hydroxy-2-oxoglutarate aldolase